MADSSQPGSILKNTGYINASTSSTNNNNNGEEKLYEYTGSEEDQQNPINKKFLFFVVFISCCGLSLILLAAFLWRKYTRTPNCDTSVLDQNQQSQQQYMQYAEIQAETEMGGYIDGNRTKMTAGYMTQAAAAGPSSQMMAPNSNQKAPCLNCRLIQMGSAISYGDNSCPQCGETVVA